MIKTYVYDIEILPNFFSITIVDLKSYLEVFNECVNDKGNPIPTTQKYSVKEIEDKLKAVKSFSFHISDTDDSQRLTMVSFFNTMRRAVIPNTNEPITFDLYGYNILGYDNLMIAQFLSHATQDVKTSSLITILYNTSKTIINIQKDKNNSWKDPVIGRLRRFRLPYRSVDLMALFALNKVATMVDKSGNKISIPKSLKQTSINLQWYKLLEFQLPPINEEEAEYYHNLDEFRGISIQGLNKLIEEWDRYILPQYVETMLIYNKNDVFICCEMVRLKIDELRLRYSLSKSYKVNLLSSSRSNISDILFEKFYSQFSNTPPEEWKGQITERKGMSFKTAIFDFIRFKTPKLQAFLTELKKKTVYSVNKDAYSELIKLGNLEYSVAMGGLHSKDIPKAYYSKWDAHNSSTGDVSDQNAFKYIHFDITSYYPSIISIFNIAPKHLNREAFVKLVTWLKDTRIAAKHSKEPMIDGIPKGILAEALKIVINSIYGKLGYEKGNICDRMCVVQTTLNGQLMILMLCEELELNDIEIISANTDGIVIKLYKNKIEKYNEIVENWKKITKMDGDSEDFFCYITRDINNYFCQELNGKLTYKGALNPNMYLADLSKGYDMPVIAKAVVEYFINKTPVLETLYNCKNILDFCKTQNIGKQYHIEESISTNNGFEIRKSQRNCRFYISLNGGMLEKVNANTGVRARLCAGQKCTILNNLDDKNIEFRNIKYNYYYDEALKIINPIELSIPPAKKADSNKMTKSGKALVKKYSGSFNKLFD